MTARRIVAATLLTLTAAISALLLGTGAAGANTPSADAYILQVESDPGAGTDFTFVTYPTYDDLINDTNRLSIDTAIPRISGTASTTGLTYAPTVIDPDSDGDGIADDADVCPGQDDTIDVDNDTIPDCNDPLIDSDGDGIADDADVCPGQDDTIDVDNDTIPDCNDPLIDTDNDGIADDRDLCPDTVLPDQPRRRLGFFRLAAQPDGTFDAGWRRLDGRFTLEDTRGCSGAQIIDELGLGRRHQKFGISFGALKYWIRHVA